MLGFRRFQRVVVSVASIRLTAVGEFGRGERPEYRRDAAGVIA
jgi:hypothetical protein